MGDMDALQGSVNRAFGFKKEEKNNKNFVSDLIDDASKWLSSDNDKVKEKPAAECKYSESDIKDMSRTQINKVLFVSGFNGDDAGKACIKMIHNMERNGYIPSN